VDTLQTAILDSIHHLDNDATYVADLVVTTDANGLIDALAALLLSFDLEQVSTTCGFIRDMVLIAQKHDIDLQGGELFHKSAIIPQLESLVFADNHFIRAQDIYTLGKVCSTRSVPILHRAFHHLRDRDPLLLPGLLFEVLETCGLLC
jgi:hypothetical protein